MQVQDTPNKASKIAFLPLVGLPSTEWVGSDVAKYLEEHSDVDILRLDKFEEHVDADVIFIFKLLPSLSWLITQKKRGKKIVYFPIDYFYLPEIVKRDRSKLLCIDSIALHNMRLKKYLGLYCHDFHAVDHHLKYHLDKKREYIEDGFVLWIGHLEYLPPLFDILAKVSIPFPLKILTDLENFEGKLHFLSDKLGAGAVVKTEGKWSAKGYVLEQWSAEKQNEYMQTCKAAFDNKSESFAHQNKPPTKAQQYIYNRIPFAIGKTSYSYEYFADKGLETPSPEQIDDWLSRDYFDRLNTFVDNNLHTQTLTTVAANYIDIAGKTALRQLRSTFLLKVYWAFDNIEYIIRRVIQKSIEKLHK